MARQLLVLLLLPITLAASSEVLIWTGAADGSTWNMSGNWKPTASGYSVPGELTDIEINVNASMPINVPTGWVGIINSINVQLGALMLNPKSSLTVKGDMTLYGALQLQDSSTLTIMGSFIATTAARRRSVASVSPLQISGLLSLQNSKVSVGTTAQISSFVVISSGNSIIQAPGGVQFSWMTIQLLGDSLYPCTLNSSLFIEGFAHFADTQNRLSTHHRDTSHKGSPAFSHSQLVVQDELTISNQISIQIIYQEGAPGTPSPIVANKIILDNAVINSTFEIPDKYDEECELLNASYGIKHDAGIAACYTANSGSIIVLLTDCDNGDAFACAPGYSGAGCATPICPGNCNGQGKCTSSYPSAPYCVCNPGWKAAGDCSLPSCETYDNCNGDHGTCVVASPLPQCVCTASWSGATCATPVCNECNSHQYCEGLVNPPVCQCTGGWKGPTCEQPSTSSCPNDCSGHGTCDPTTAICKCDSQWGGLGCSAPLCSNNCSFRGVCNTQHVCECSAGYTGADCSQGTCVGGCENGGACLTSGASPVCVCREGWYGNRCELEVLSGTQPPSKHHGLSKSQKVMIISICVGATVILGAALFFFRDSLRQALICNSKDDIPYSEFR